IFMFLWKTDSRRHSSISQRQIAIAPIPVIPDRSLFGARPMTHRLQLGRCAITIIGVSRGEQLPRDFSVPRRALELMDDVAVPLEAQPVAPVNDRRNRFRSGPNAVGVLDAQQEHAAV